MEIKVINQLCVTLSGPEIETFVNVVRKVAKTRPKAGLLKSENDFVKDEIELFKQIKQTIIPDGQT